MTILTIPTLSDAVWGHFVPKMQPLETAAIFYGRGAVPGFPYTPNTMQAATFPSTQIREGMTP